MALGYGPKDLFEEIGIYSPDIIGITMMTFNYRNHYKLINEIKSRFKNIAIAVGGAHVSLMREKVLADCPDIDYGVVLEGEKTMLELCQGNDLSKIGGLIYRKNSEIVFNGERSFIENLDDIPYPKYGSFELDKYPYPNSPERFRDIPIVSSRGCPYQCIFCPVKSAIGEKFRYRSPENMLKELGYWYEKGYRTFWFADDNFTLLKERVSKFCDLIDKSGMKDLSLGCGNGIRADRVDIELLKKMKNAGFKVLAFGVESGSDRILKIYKKSETLLQIETGIKNAIELGFSVGLCFLIGAPGETPQDVEKSFELARRYPIDGVRFYHITPYPKTELYEWIEKNSYFVAEPAEYLNSVISFQNNPVYKTPELPLNVRKKLFKKAKKIENYIENNFYARKFIKLGTPKLIAGVLASLYRTSIINRILNLQIRGKKLREHIKKLYI